MRQLDLVRHEPGTAKSDLDQIVDRYVNTPDQHTSARLHYVLPDGKEGEASCAYSSLDEHPETNIRKRLCRAGRTIVAEHWWVRLHAGGMVMVTGFAHDYETALERARTLMRRAAYDWWGLHHPEKK